LSATALQDSLLNFLLAAHDLRKQSREREPLANQYQDRAKHNHDWDNDHQKMQVSIEFNGQKSGKLRHI
jgi:hypothetical protein